MLRAPRLVVTRADGSSFGSDVRMSYRQAPGVFGLGLLEAVSDETLSALADPDDADRDGVSGRVNLVWDSERRTTAIGRFGHKATVPTLRQQVAAAFANDIGLSNTIFPEPDGMRDAFELVLQHAQALGANAVVGLRYDATEVMQGVTEVLCYGTAVVVARE